MPALACRLVSERAFPVIFATRVTATAEFYQRLGFTKHFQLPPDGEYVADPDGNPVALAASVAPAQRE